MVPTVITLSPSWQTQDSPTSVISNSLIVFSRALSSSFASMATPLDSALPDLTPFFNSALTPITQIH